MHMSSPAKRWHRWLVLMLILACAGAHAAPAFPERFSAVYTLKKGPLTIGETRRTLTPEGDGRYVFESVTRPVGVTKLLTNGQVVERSTWRDQQGAFQPQEYTYFNSGAKNKRRVRLLFDWQARTVTNVINGEPWKMPLAAGTQDKLLYQLQLMQDLLNGKKARSYPIADGGKLKTYVLEWLGAETIRTPLGEFETVRLRRTHGKRRTTIWCAKTLDYLPVRIEHRKGNDSPVNAILRAVQGIPNNPGAGKPF